jgi:hypothetical protein
MVRAATSKIKSILGSKWFYLFILLFFIFESAWIALSAVYPQAFDEDFHFGLIKVYSHYWLPFLAHQPIGANAFGAVARDPSYLYHYLMSFPYRLFAHFIHDQTAQVIFLRFINIGLFVSGLVLFRRILRRIGTSKELANTMLLIFVLIPVVPLLAAQINYDDLLFPLVAWTCLLTFNVVDQLKIKQPSARSILILGSVCLLSSLVKVAFLPIFAAVVLFVAFMAYQNFKGAYQKLWSGLVTSFRQLSWVIKVLLVVLTLISLGMFIQRDGVNLIAYHTVTPRCDAILSVQQCSAYNIWLHDYSNHQQLLANQTTVSSSPIAWVGEWMYWMWYRLFFAVNGPNSSFANYPPLPLPAAASILIVLISIFAIFKWRRRLFHDNPYLIFLVLASVLYIIALMLTGYETYKYTAVLEIMNGRYLLPVLLLLGALAGRAISLMLRKRETYKVLAVVIALALFLQGGGFLTFITRSDQSWYWPNQTVTKVNNVAGSIVKHVVVQGRKTYSTGVWFFN